MLQVSSKSNVARFLYEAIQIPDGFTEGSTTVSCDQQVSVIGLQFDGAIFATLPPAIFDKSPQTIIRGEAAPERAALEAFYDATGGPDWTDSTSWKTAAPLGQWYGVMTVDESGRVDLAEDRGEQSGRIHPARIGSPDPIDDSEPRQLLRRHDPGGGGRWPTDGAHPARTGRANQP